MKMNLAAMIVGFAMATTAFAQPAKKMSPPPPPPAPAHTAPAYSGYAENEITANLGFVAGAVNIGASYVHPMSDFGVGGYFFYQSSKDKNNTPLVSGVTALGALIKLNLLDNHHWSFSVSPGFGLAIVKDGELKADGGKSDVTLFSPTFKMAVQYKFTPNVSVGLERMQFTNWLSDSLNYYAAPAEYYSVAATFAF